MGNSRVDRFLIYTSVFGGYDRVFSPVQRTPFAKHIVVSEDKSLNVEGWTTVYADESAFASHREANRYFKMLGHSSLGEFDVSVYVDGNIRVIGDLTPLIDEFLRSDCALGIYRHPVRSSIEEEVSACIAKAKISNPDRINRQQSEFLRAGFRDDVGLFEATIILKSHRRADLDPAMSLWWKLFRENGERDQVCLPFALWKTGIDFHVFEKSFRSQNPYFGIYPHFGGHGVSKNYAYHYARSYDSRLHRLILGAWHAKWWLQRRARTFAKAWL